MEKGFLISRDFGEPRDQGRYKVRFTLGRERPRNQRTLNSL